MVEEQGQKNRKQLREGRWEIMCKKVPELKKHTKLSVQGSWVRIHEAVTFSKVKIGPYITDLFGLEKVYAQRSNR